MCFTGHYQESEKISHKIGGNIYKYIYIYTYIYISDKGLMLLIRYKTSYKDHQ